MEKTSLKSDKVVEFCPFPKTRVGTLTPLEEDPSPSNSNFEDDPLVSGPIEPITLPLELLIPSLGKKVKLRAFQDLGCIRCLISPNLVGAWGST